MVHKIENITEIWYKNRTQTYNRFKEKLEENGFGRVSNRSKLHSIIYKILLLHPDRVDKIGKGIKYFSIDSNYDKGYQIKIHRVDNTEDNFSYKKCIQKYSKNTYYKTTDKDRHMDRYIEKFKDACRNETYEQTKSFKLKELGYSTKSICKGCKQILLEEQLAVDHKDKLFCEILVLFIEYCIDKEIELPTRFDVIETIKGARFCDEDSFFREEWLTFHKERASYQLLCSSCNTKSYWYWKKNPNK